MRKGTLIFKRTMLILMNAAVLSFLAASASIVTYSARAQNERTLPENSVVYDIKIDQITVNDLGGNLHLDETAKSITFEPSASNPNLNASFELDVTISAYLVKTEEDVFTGANLNLEIPELSFSQPLTETSPGIYQTSLRQTIDISSAEPLMNVGDGLLKWKIEPKNIYINHKRLDYFSFTDYLMNINFSDDLVSQNHQIPIELMLGARITDQDDNPVQDESISLDFQLPDVNYQEKVDLKTDKEGYLSHKKDYSAVITIDGGNLTHLTWPLAYPEPSRTLRVVPLAGSAYDITVPFATVGGSSPIVIFWEGKRQEPSYDRRDAENLGDKNNVGDPISLVTGNVYSSHQDIFISAKGIPIDFTRYYNSKHTYEGPLGHRWTHSYNMNITVDWETSEVALMDEDGRRVYFFDSEDGTFISPRGERSILTRNANGTYSLKRKNGIIYSFASNGLLTSITDTNQNQLTFTYLGTNLIAIMDASQRSLELFYDPDNRIIRILDPKGREFLYEYDGEGNLSVFVDPEGVRTHYSYSSFHELAGITEPNNVRRAFSYYESGGFNGMANEFSYAADNYKITLEYGSEANRKATVTDSKGNDTVYYYSEHEAVTKVVYTDGSTEEFTYDEELNKTSVKDRSGQITNFTYDDRANLLSSRTILNIGLPDEEVIETQFTYEESYNRLTSITDARGNITSYIYDTEGNLERITSPAPFNYQTIFTYTQDGLLESTINPKAQTVEFTHDQYGNLETTTDAKGSITKFSYDEIGNVLSVTEAYTTADEATTTFGYDLSNRLIYISYPDFTTTTFAYDGSGNRTSVTDALSHTTSYKYDYYNRLERVIDPLENITAYSYDTEGNLTKLKDANGNITRYYYDLLNRLVRKADAKGIETLYEYDSRGNRTSLTDGKGNTINYDYDALNRLTRITYPDSSTIEFTYDKLGRRTSMTDSTGTTTYGYDELSRLKQVDGPQADDTISYEYDELGNRARLIDQDGGQTIYTYDNDLNHLISVTDPRGKTTAYAYDDNLGTLESISYPNSTTATYTYDKLKRILSLVNKNPQQNIISSFSYTYDDAGRRTSVALPDGSIQYGYDDANRLTSEVRTASQDSYSIQYEYDAVGNRTRMAKDSLSHVYTYNELNQLLNVDRKDIIPTKTITVSGTTDDTQAQITVNSVDATVNQDGTFTAGNISLNKGENIITAQARDQAENTYITQTRVILLSQEGAVYYYDKNGNLIEKQTSTTTTTYTYDYENRLTQIDQNGTPIAQYTYDGEGKRIIATEDGITTHYFYDGLLPIIERNPSGATIASYVRGLSLGGGIGGIISRYASDPVYYHYDPLGNVVNLTDQQGSAINNYVYDAFGNTVHQSGSLTNPYQFSTRDHNLTTGLVYFGARYYDPFVGRWITKDPVGITGGFNLYVYCNNDPVNNSDFWGNKAGDKYPTQDTAADAASNEIHEPSVNKDKEHGAYIYENKDKTYSYTPPKEGKQHSLDLGPKPSNSTAYYHSHGAESGPGWDDENFSPQDKKVARDNNIDGYLVTPSGKIKKYDHKTNKETEIRNVRGKSKK